MQSKRRQRRSGSAHRSQETDRIFSCSVDRSVVHPGSVAITVCTLERTWTKRATAMDLRKMHASVLAHNQGHELLAAGEALLGMPSDEAISQLLQARGRMGHGQTETQQSSV